MAPLENDVFLVFAVSESFQSKITFGLSGAYEAAMQFVFGEIPDNYSQSFDEYVSLRNDFHNESLWEHGGSLWQSDFSGGYVTIIKVQSLIN